MYSFKAVDCAFGCMFGTQTEPFAVKVGHSPDRRVSHVVRDAQLAAIVLVAPALQHIHRIVLGAEAEGSVQRQSEGPT